MGGLVRKRLLVHGLYNQWPVQHLFVQFDVLVRTVFVTECIHAFHHYPFNLEASNIRRKHVVFHGLVNGSKEAIGIKDIEKKPVAPIVVCIHVGDCIVDATGIVCNRKRAVFRSDHLGKTARFELGRHQYELGER
jgi:hypothetical protein